MTRQPDHERKPVIIRLEQRRGRAVGRHFLQDFRNAGGSPLGHVQLLQELADAPVAVAPADRTARLQVFHAYRSLRAGEAEDGQFIVADAHLDGLTLLVGAVIDRVHHGLFDGGERVIPDPRGLGAVGMLDDRLAQKVALDVAQRLARHPRQRPLEDLLVETVAARAFGEPDHIDLHAGEEPLRRFVEKQQAHVLGPRRFAGAARHVHLTRQRLDGKPRRIRRQRAAHFLQEALHQGLGKIIDACELVEAVVERNLRRQAQQLLLGVALGLDRAAVAADVVAPGFLAGRDRFRCLVRSRLSARRLQHDQVAAIDHFDTQYREIRRLNQLAVRQQFALDFVELVVRQADRRKHGLAVGVAVLPDHHVAAAQVLEVVGEGAEGADDRVRVPAGLVLDALALDRALAQQVVEVDGEFVATRLHFCASNNAFSSRSISFLARRTSSS